MNDRHLLGLYSPSNGKSINFSLPFLLKSKVQSRPLFKEQGRADPSIACQKDYASVVGNENCPGVGVLGEVIY